MKILRTVSLVVVILGIFAWFFIPFLSATELRATDGAPASSLIFYSSTDFSACKATPLYWMPLVSVILLCVCLLFVLLNDYRWVGIFSFAAIVSLASGGRLTQTFLHTLPSHLVGGNLSVGYFLLIGIFGVLLGLSIIALCRVKEILRALSVLFIIVGGVVWFTAPFLGYEKYHGVQALSCSSFAFLNGLEHVPFLESAWSATPIYWLPLVSAILLGVCLLFACLKDFRWLCASSFAGLATVISGGLLSTHFLKLSRMHLGIGFYLLAGLFAAVMCFSILYIKEQKDAQRRLVMSNISESDN